MFHFKTNGIVNYIYFSVSVSKVDYKNRTFKPNKDKRLKEVHNKFYLYLPVLCTIGYYTQSAQLYCLYSLFGLPVSV